MCKICVCVCVIESVSKQQNSERAFVVAYRKRIMWMRVHAHAHTEYGFDVSIFIESFEKNLEEILIFDASVDSLCHAITGRTHGSTYTSVNV